MLPRSNCRRKAKLKSGSDLKIGVDFSVTVNVESAKNVEGELRQVLEDLGLAYKIRIEQSLL